MAEGTTIEVVRIPPRSPNLNLSERQLRRVLKEYVEIYFNPARPHQGLWQGIPVAGSRSVPKVGGKVVPVPILGGLHHDYQRAA